MRNGKQARDEMVMDVTGQNIMLDGVEVRRRWTEYFEQVLNVADVREANINVVGNWRMPVLSDKCAFVRDNIECCSLITIN